MGATVWLVQQWNPGTHIALLDKPDSGTPWDSCFRFSKSECNGVRVYCREMVDWIPAINLAGWGMFDLRLKI